jgi:hypothetical protein
MALNEPAGTLISITRTGLSMGKLKNKFNAVSPFSRQGSKFLQNMDNIY